MNIFKSKVMAFAISTSVKASRSQFTLHFRQLNHCEFLLYKMALSKILLSHEGIKTNMQRQTISGNLKLTFRKIKIYLFSIKCFSEYTFKGLGSSQAYFRSGSDFFWTKTGKEKQSQLVTCLPEDTSVSCSIDINCWATDFDYKYKPSGRKAVVPREKDTLVKHIGGQQQI